MTHDEHPPHRENIPAYALGALDAEEIAALETHLETCVSCRAELAEYRLVGESLLMSVPPRQPSAAVRNRLLNRLPGAIKSQRPQLTFSLGRLALGLSIIVLIILNLFSFLQVRQIPSQQASLLNQVENAQAALAMISSPNVQLFPIEDGNVAGTVILSNQQNQAMLIVRNLLRRHPRDAGPVACLAEYAWGPTGIRVREASCEGNPARTETSTEQSFMIHCRKDDRRAVHTRCMSSRIPSIGAVCFAVFMTVTVLWPSPARADGWTLPGSHSEWGSFALGIISGLGVHELAHVVVARTKGYSTSYDGLSIVYPDEDLAGADQLQVASAGFQAQWLMTEIALRDSQGRTLKTPPGNFAAGVVCAHLGISLAYLTFLKNHKQGDVYGPP